jgi:hypothetical protein
MGLDPRIPVEDLHKRPELPPVERGFRGSRGAGWQVEERLFGLLLVLLGCAGVAAAAFLTQVDLPIRPPTPPGMPRALAPSPLTCLYAVIAFGGLGLAYVGLRRMVDP